MTPDRVKSLRARLGMTAAAFGRMLHYTGDPGRTVRRIERGDVGISGPVRALLTLLEQDGTIRHTLEEASENETH